MKKLFGIILFSLVFCLAVSAEVGVTDKSIALGSSAALGGPNAFLGTEFHKGAKIIFNDINAKGGIYGRKITIKVLDDGYEPVRTIKNTKDLIKKDKVFCLFGYIGTPTTYSIRKTIKAEKVPLFSAFTGAGGLRKPVIRYMLNVRTSYNQETAGLVDHLLNDCGVDKIACFYQDDSYGMAGYTGVKLGLENFSLTMCGEGKYKRNTVNVMKGLNDIKKTNPDAVIMIGQYTACATFIKKARKAGLDKAYFCNISFVGSDKLNSLLGDDGEGSICSQTVPDLANNENPLTPKFVKAYKKAYPKDEANRVSYEGYISAMVFVDGLKRAGKTLTREGFIDAVETIKNLDIGVGDKLNFGKYDHQGLDKVYYSIVKDGKEISLTDWVKQAKK